MRYCIVFGGAGYIGEHLFRRLASLDWFDRLISVDIREPKNSVEGVNYLYGDVRKAIDSIQTENIDANQSWVFNLAAIHREPGHQPHEYFDTNIHGAININEFSANIGITNLYFTSSIAPYGRSRSMKSEKSDCHPETPYGISKWKAESIHEIWQKSQANRRLIICRPSVIYGPGDPGNVLRMIKGVLKGTFFIPGDPNIVKSHGYIEGLIDSILFTMQKDDGYILYNYAENPCIPLGEMVASIKNSFGIKRPVPRIPLFLLILISKGISLLWKKGPIHPVRVKKASFPTNIKPEYLIDSNFDFKYDFPRSLEVWKKKSPEDFL